MVNNFILSIEVAIIGFCAELNYFDLILLDLEVSPWVNNMAQQVETLATISEMIPGTHITEGKNQQLLQAASDIHIPTVVHVPIYIHTK